MSEAQRDGNHVASALGVSSTSSTTTLPFKIDSSTGRLLTDSASGTGDVVGPASSTDNAVVRFDGATGKLVQNSAVIIADTTGAISGTQSITIGVTGTATGTLLFKGTTSGTITLKSADVAGTYTLTLPTTDGNASEFLQTDGNGVLTWAAGAAGANTALSNLAAVAINTSLISDTDATDDLGSAAIKWNNIFGVNLGATGTRFTTGWFTDLTVTNAIAGSITGTAAVATTITTADEATDTTCFITFVTAATGNLGNKTNTNMTFNSNTGVATFASTVLTTTDINGGTIDGTSIGASSASTIIGTTIQANTSFLPDADGGAALGSATLGFSILGLASASTINWANGNAVLTHSSGVLTISTGDLRVTTAGTNAASVVTVGGTQTLTAKTLTSPAITTATFTGTQVLAENASIALDPAGSADGKYTGITIAGTAGTTLAFGDLVYLASADSRWELADADAATTADRMLGMVVLAAAADGDPTVLLLIGQIRADAKFPALTIGSPVYVGETAGAIQVAIPTGADNVIRRVGYALTADEIYFNPSMDAQTTVA